ncbi:signal peptidase I [Actinocorallia sp. API 0066]|uniref:signal peptidase I n=1 Tax=Actinocorallia sp. API 0066 TaxID=2896846 RepID=UPI001E57D59E|nr:signal peptidase I [Actinocorallia sp. API 0066]MCD0448404.1 signal peptidase I [Actinocorallia sp. API 0066]
MSDEEPGPTASGEERRPVRSDTDGVTAGEGEETEGSEAPAEERRRGAFWKELPVLIGVALVLALVIKTFVVQAFYIPSASMESTLQIGDRVLVNKLVYKTRPVARGDIVVFNGLDSWDPEVQVAEPANPVQRALRAVGTAFGVVPGEKDYIKRVVGIPGDHVVCCDAQTGRITINGTPLDESAYLYRDPGSGEQNAPSTQKFDVVVPPGRLWVMGDHRKVSWDSRGHQADPGSGTIPVSSVIGRAFVVVWPVSHWQILGIPSAYARMSGTSAAPAGPSGGGVAAVAALPFLLPLRRF